MKRLTCFAVIALSLVPVLANRASAQQGGCVFAETAPIYAHSSGDKIEYTASKGFCVGGVDGFEKKDERVHVVYFANAEQKGTPHTAWMNPSDLSPFDYDCSCDDSGNCKPIHRSFTSVWYPCFIEARDKKLAALAAPAQSAPAAARPLTNDDVIALTKAGLGDDVVLAKITSAPAVKFDTSVDALIRLKQEKVGKTVIEAMVKQPEKTAQVASVGSSTKLRSVSADQVRVTSSSDAIKGCKSLGMVHASIDTFWGGGTKTVTKRLQEQAASHGANTVLLMGSFTTVQKNNGSEMMGDGEAFACGD